MSSHTDKTTSHGPICPNCHLPLRGNLRHEQTVARDSSCGGSRRSVNLTYCGACGFTLSVHATRNTFVDADGPGRDEIVAPADPTSLAGQFQLHLSALVDEVEPLGFTPRGWISLVNQPGAVEATKHLLAEDRILPVTQWLLDQGHAELTMEQALSDPAWQELFTDDERARALERLERLTARDASTPRHDPA
jgi:hypothetical protein